MYSKVPLFDVFDDFLITLRGSFVVAYEGKMQSYEGVEDVSSDVEFLSSFIKSYAGLQTVYFSIIVENVRNENSEVFQKHLVLHKNHPLSFLVAQKKVSNLKDKIFRRVYFVLEHPVFETPQEFYECTNFNRKIKEVRERLDVVCENFERQYFGQYGILPKKMTGMQMWQHLFKMVNPYLTTVPEKISFERSAREQLFLEDVNDAEGSLLKYGDTYFSFVNLDLLPDVVSYETGCELFFKIPFEVRMVVNVEIPNQVDVKNELSSQRTWAVTFTSRKRGNPESERNKKKIEAIEGLLEVDKDLLVKTNVCFAVWGKTTREVNAKVEKLKNLILTTFKNSACYTSRGKKVKYFLSSLGYFPSYSFPKHVTTLTASLCLVPYRSSFEGIYDEPVSLFSNRGGGIATISLFSKRQNRWSFLVIGPTGSGKSFVTNYLIFSHLSLKAKVVIIDLAAMSSYETLVKLVGGEYVEVKPTGKGLSRNVFDFPLGHEFPSENKIAFLLNFFSYVLADPNAPLVKEDLEFIQRAIKRLYEKFLYEDPKLIPEEEYEEYAKYTTWIAMRDILLEKALREAEKGNLELRDKYVKLAEFAHRKAMPVLEDFAATLSMDSALNLTSEDVKTSDKLRRRLNLYTGGIAKKLIGSTTEFDASSDFVVLNLGFLREQPNLFVPVYMSYREYFWDKMAVHLDEVPEVMKKLYGTDYFVFQQTRPKFIVVDEFHNFNAARELIWLTDKDMRQTRTYGISVGIITQSLKDVIYESQNEKFSIFESASNKFFLRHTSPQNPQKQIIDYVVEKTGMNSKERELFESLRLVPGKYSEIFYLGEEVGKGVLVYEPTPQELWINTTHKKERYLRDGLVSELFEECRRSQVVKGRLSEERVRAIVVEEVISYLAESYPEGVSRLDDEEVTKIFEKSYEVLRKRVFDRISIE